MEKYLHPAVFLLGPVSTLLKLPSLAARLRLPELLVALTIASQPSAAAQPLAATEPFAAARSFAAAQPFAAAPPSAAARSSAAAQLSPATQPASSAGSYLRAEDARIADVGYRLATRGKGYCSPTHPITGLLLHHLGEYHLRDQPRAAAELGLKSGPGVLAVVAGSPAAASGLSAGDVLLSANGSPFAAPERIAAEPDAKKRRKLIEQSEAQLEEQLKRGPVKLEVLREGRRLTLPLTPIPGCEIRTRLARSTQANAFANGRYAIMTTKMLEFVQNDDELAVIMAHEAAHNLLGHPGRLEDEKVPHGILRNFGGNAAKVRATEEEADRLGVKLLWAAGYNVNAAIPFWRRLYAKYDPIPIPKLLRTHPSFGARERMINEVIRELGAPQAAAR
jgi:Zn-dependent protease with chaperone function